MFARTYVTDSIKPVPRNPRLMSHSDLDIVLNAPEPAETVWVVYDADGHTHRVCKTQDGANGYIAAHDLAYGIVGLTAVRKALFD